MLPWPPANVARPPQHAELLQALEQYVLMATTDIRASR